MRVGELVALTSDDVDVTACQIRVRHAKLGELRDIGFGKETHKYLTRYLTLCHPAPMVVGGRHLLLSLDV